MTTMTESATKQIERLATAIREMQDQGMKVNKNRLSKYMNEEKGDNISIVTVGKYFDQAIKQVNGGSSKASTSPSTSTAGDKGRSELLRLYIRGAAYTQGETSDGEPLEGDAIFDAMPDVFSLRQAELVKKMQEAMSPTFDGDLDFSERFEKIELLGFDGPVAVFSDRKRDMDARFNDVDPKLLLTHLGFIVRVDYSKEVEDLDDDDMEETRLDLWHLLMVDLCFDKATLSWGELGSYGAEVIDSVPDDMVERHEVWNAS
jgi:hypothetical protein